MTNEPEFPESEGPEQASDVPEINDVFGTEDAEEAGSSDAVTSDSPFGDAEANDSLVNDSESADEAPADYLQSSEGSEHFDDDLSDVDSGYDEDENEPTENAGASFPAPPPVAGPVPAARHLTRDPYTSFGGVASGLAHHFGIDVSIVRIAFVALTIAGGGLGLLLYFLGWIVIPRAKFWPPMARSEASAGVSGRELGFMLTGLGVLVLWFSAGGIGAQILVPLLLVGGGIWFLTQPDRRVLAPSTGSAPPPAGTAHTVTHPPTASPANTQATMGQPGTAQPGNYGQAPMYAMPYEGAPVAPRSRSRRILRPLAIIGIFVLPVLAVAALIIGVVVFAATEGEWETTVDGVTLDKDVGTVVETPQTFEDIPQSIDASAGEIVLDLTTIDPATFVGDPVSVEIDNSFGSVVVILPEGMDVEVQAEVTAGEIRVFDKGSSGLGGSLSYGKNDPMVDLDISVNAGEILVGTGDQIDYDSGSIKFERREVDLDPFDD